MRGENTAEGVSVPFRLALSVKRIEHVSKHIIAIFEIGNLTYSPS